MSAKGTWEFFMHSTRVLLVPAMCSLCAVPCDGHWPPVPPEALAGGRVAEELRRASLIWVI